MNIENKINLSLCINKPLEEVQKLINSKGLISRIREIDGKSKMVTMDFKSNRINLYIRNGIVFDAKVG